MTQGIAHIRNPLTIIGIFASLVELMGLGILPLVDKDIQHIYIWFLMFFPTALVASFFFVLYTKHQVLYAPSDYRDDKSFTDLAKNISPATEEMIEAKRSEEAAQVVEVASSKGDDLPNSEASQEARPHADAVAPEGAVVDVDEKPAFSREHEAEVAPSKSTRGFSPLRAEFAEKLAIDHLEKRLSLSFERNVNYEGPGTYLFDGLYIGEKGVIAVEVKYTRGGILKTANIEKLFAGPQYLCSVLPASIQARLHFVLVFVADPNNQEERERVQRSLAKISSLSKKYSFKTSVEIIEWEKLKQS